MNILVIGGTGVISTCIVDRLHELSHHVTIVNRGVHKVRCKVKPEIIIADTADKEQFGAALAGREFDGVIDVTSYTAENAALVLDAIGYRGHHFVFTSTVAAYARPAGKIPFTEDCELTDREDFFPYGYRKARMEDFLRSKMKELPITIIRPSLTYGVGCKNVGVMRNNYGIVQRLRRNKPIVVFGDGMNPWAWTFAPDLAKAYAGVVSRPICYGQVYHATSDDRRVWDDLYAEFGRCTGVEPKLVHISTEMLLKVSSDPFLNIAQEKMYPGIFDNSKIRKAAPEFVCDYTLDKIVRALYEWYESDPEARIIDEERDKLEDTVITRYERCLKIMAGE
jgi:nucleoside-diphosphate-sugar epimerase